MAVLYIDLDDTLVNFLEGVCDLHNKLYPEEPMKVEELDDWHENAKFINPYLASEGLYKNLTIKPDAIRVLRKLANRHELKILTAFPTPQSAKEKVEFVMKHLPFIGVECMTLTWDKGLMKGDLLFDDSPRFLPSFEGVKVCFDQTYNQDIEPDFRVTSWLDFQAVVEQLEAEGKLKPSFAED